ncbi:MAG: Re/Si-specific NAD(P)(+) transhydrogenase subunit alpha [Gammaproteobacteria bacterium]
MRIGVPKEIHQNEKRVAATPETIGWLKKLGFEVVVEAGAGAAADFPDQAYRDGGAEIISDSKELWGQADIILKVRGPEPHPTLGVHEADLLKQGGTLISFLWPAQNPDLLERLSKRQATVLAMDSVPRMSRAQKLDALSSMANIAGYRAVIEAAANFGRFFTGQITAAGKVPPAKVLIIGAGVAGLAAVGVAGSMGAMVRSFDTRPEVKEQVESMGAEFLLLDFAEDGGGSGGYAKTMSPEFIQEGSVIVDLAAEQGGNCALTEPDRIVVKHGVTIIGYTDLPSRMAAQSSQLYGTNLRHMLAELCKGKDGQIDVNMEDEVIRGATVLKEGKITWPPPAPKLQAAPSPQKPTPATAPPAEKGRSTGLGAWLLLLVAGACLYGLGQIAPSAFLSHFTVFVLACVVGYMVIWNVTPALHTPLMSVTNAISGIIVIGALLQISSSSWIVVILAAIATLIATVNVFGGFFVTQRMLRMFRK